MFESRISSEAVTSPHQQRAPAVAAASDDVIIRNRELEKKCEFCSQQLERTIVSLQNNLLLRHRHQDDDDDVTTTVTNETNNGGGGGGGGGEDLKEAELFLIVANLKQVSDWVRQRH